MKFKKVTPVGFFNIASAGSSSFHHQIKDQRVEICFLKVYFKLHESITDKL